MNIAYIGLIIPLISMTAFFVIIKYAICHVRMLRIEELYARGDKRALSLKMIVCNLDDYIRACQFGIVFGVLCIGWIGVSIINQMVKSALFILEVPPSIFTFISIILSFSLIIFFLTVFAENISKIIAIQKAEQISLSVALPLIIFKRYASPLIFLFVYATRVLVKFFGLPFVKGNHAAHSEEELRLLISESYENGGINQSEFKLVNKIFEFNDRLAKEVMVPRTEMITVDYKESIADVIHMMAREKYTRYPVTAGDKDHIIGIINFKDIFPHALFDKPVYSSISNYIRPVIKVIESMPIHKLLLQMQHERIHLAILVDEYGGTSGLVTFEDIVEEIVGEIHDEFDTDEQPEIQCISDTKTILDGKVLVSNVNELFGLSIDDSDVDTISGWILTKRFEIHENDSIQIENYTFCIREMDGHSIKHVEVIKQIPHKLPKIAISIAKRASS